MTVCCVNVSRHPPPPHTTEALKQKDYFGAHKSTLLQEYRNKWICIHGERVAFADDTWTGLAGKLAAVGGLSDSYMVQVTDAPSFHAIDSL